jgi:nicotinate-nucleotide adenylyltransferase
LPRWHQPSRLIGLCYLVAVPRPGQAAPDLDSLEDRVPGVSQRVILMNGPMVDISATDIRQRVDRGVTFGQLVPPPVAQYINKHRLYLTRQG